jgi:hypothetical protein
MKYEFRRKLFRLGMLAFCAAGIAATSAQDADPIALRMKTPLVTHMYTADPSAHVFEDRIYLYPSHDRETDTPRSHEGDQYDMADYHVLSMKDLQSDVVDHGRVLGVEDVPWAARQFWAPDAVHCNGAYHLVFPAKDSLGIFRLGVARGASPAGPFTPDAEPIAGSFSIDPCAFVDADARVYLYFGGLWGGQLERWRTGTYDPDGKEPQGTEPALGPRVARLNDDLTGFDGPIEEISIVDADGKPLAAADSDRRFFEGAWVHRYNGKYYLSYSTGNTHYLVYATADSPTGPFTYRGRLMNPVVGWTTHHSIVEFDGRWWLFYHDSTLSGGVSHKRCVKFVEIHYDSEGAIETIDP